MLLKSMKPGLERQLLGSAAAITLIVGGVAATASYGYAAEKDESAKDEEVSTLVEILHENDVVVVEDEDGKRIEKRIRVVTNGDETDANVFVLKDGDIDVVVDELHGPGKKIHKVIKRAHGSHAMGFHMSGDCVAEDGEGNPVKLEWKDEQGEKGDKRVTHTIICLDDEDANADPKTRAKKLREMIDRLEENAKKEEAQRKKMIEALRKQARDLERQK